MCFRQEHSARPQISGLRFGVLRRRIAGCYAITRSNRRDIVFKLLPWVEANLKRIIYGAVLVLIAVFIFSFYSYRQNQNEIAAGQALTQALVSNTGGGLADACLKVATDYSGTAAGQRALLEGATALFTAGNYAGAQAQFEKFLNTYPDNFFTPQAELGVAASLDAQGKTDLAFSAYQRAAGQVGDVNVVATAKFALARIDESQGKIADAVNLYTEIARTFQNSPIGSEAAQRAMELKIKAPAAVVAPAPAGTVPFNLSR